MGFRVVPQPTAFNTSRRAKEAMEVRDPRHLAWIRTLPCVVTGKYGCEAAHISFADARFGKPERARGKKAGDDWTVPLSPDAHRDQHSRNERKYWADQGIDVTTLASRLWGVSGDTEAGIAIIRQAWMTRTRLYPTGRNRTGD